MDLSLDNRIAVGLICVFVVFQILLLCILRIMSYCYERRFNLRIDNQPISIPTRNGLQINVPKVNMRLPAPRTDESADIVLSQEQARALCVICLDKLGKQDEVTMLRFCDHMFHSPCIAEWTVHRRTCPVCRRWIAKMLVVPKIMKEPVASAVDNSVVRPEIELASAADNSVVRPEIELV